MAVMAIVPYEYSPHDFRQRESREYKAGRGIDTPNVNLWPAGESIEGFIRICIARLNYVE